VSETQARLAVSGLSRSEHLDLLDHLPPGAAEVQVQELPPGEQGEPATMLVLIGVTMAALSGIGAWLASRGKDVELGMGVKVPGVEGWFTFKAKSGDTGDDLRERLEEQGVPVPAE
jgi:hypothetical protein